MKRILFAIFFLAAVFGVRGESIEVEGGTNLSPSYEVGDGGEITITVTPKEGWHFVGETHVEGTGWTKYGERGAKISYDLMPNRSSSYSGHIWGYIGTGGEGGSPARYDIYPKAEAFYITPEELVIGHGDTVENAYTAYTGSTEKKSNWTITPLSGGKVLSDTNRASITLSLAGIGDPAPGTHTVEATAKDKNGTTMSDQASLKVIKVNFNPGNKRIGWGEGDIFLDLRKYLSDGGTYDANNITWESMTNDATVGGDGTVRFLESSETSGTVKIKATSNDLPDRYDIFNFIPLKENNILDISFENVDDAIEGTTGGFVRANDNDDNEDGNVDSYIQYDNLSGDKDLLKVVISCSITSDVNKDYPITLSIPGIGYVNAFRVWDNPDRSGDPIFTDGGAIKYESIGDLPSELYVEGISSCAFGINLSYNPPGVEETIEDYVKITVVKTNITLASVSNEKTIYDDNDEVVRVEPREFNPGGYLNVNFDKSNDNLKKLTLSVSGKSLPKSSEVTLTWTSDKVELYPEKDLATTKLGSPQKFKLSELPKEFYLNPAVASTTEKDIEIKAEYTTPTNAVTVDDVIKLTNVFIDIDVDSDNNGTIESENGDEDKMENAADTLGKVTKLNDGDRDADGTPDDVDFEITGEENTFEQVKLKIGDAIDFDNCKIKISYSDSDPAKASSTTPEPGVFRLWTKKSNETRNPASVKAGGDFVASSLSGDVSTYYDPSEIFGSGREATFYLETVNMPSSTSLTITAQAVPVDDIIADFSCTDKVKVNPIALQLVTKGGSNGVSVVDSIIACTPRPQVVLNSITAAEVQIQGSNAVVTLQGYVLDPVADNLPESVADIASVQVYLDGEAYGSAKTVTRVSGGEASLWKQHPYKGEFDPIQVNIPLGVGKHVITVQTSANGAELTGHDEVAINLKRTVVTDTPAVPGTTVVCNIYLPSALGDTTQDTVKYFWGSRTVQTDDPEYQEKADELASSEFYGQIDNLDAKIKITEYTGLDTTQKDAFVAEVPFVLNGQVGYLTALFTETGIKSRLFRTKITYGGSDAITHDEWSVSSVSNLAGSGKGDTNCHTIRVKGIPNATDYRITYDGTEYELEEYNGWYYLKGGSLNVLLAVYSSNSGSDITRISYNSQASAVNKASGNYGEKEVSLKEGAKTKMVTSKNDDGLLVYSGNDLIKNAGNVAYIANTPAMPELKAKLAKQQTGTVDYKIKIEYKYPNRNDSVTYPSTGIRTITAASTWNILNEIGEDFCGGWATITFKLSGSSVERKYNFSIRGYNPSEGTAKSYLDASGFWYAYCIAKLEGGTQNGRYYIQFNEKSALGHNYFTQLKSCPNLGYYEVKDAQGKVIKKTYGWGLMQLTNPTPTVKELWNWKANIDAAITLLNEKQQLATDHLEDIANDGNGGYIEPPSITINSKAVPGFDLEVIKRYNGGSFWKKYNSMTNEWRHAPLKCEGNSTKNDYVENVMAQYEGN